METSSDKHFRKRVLPCQRFLTPDDTHKMCVICLVEDHACSVLLRELFYKKALFALVLFLKDLGRASAPSGSGPAAFEARWRLRSWGSQVELAEDFERGIFLSHSSAADADNLLDVDDLSLV